MKNLDRPRVERLQTLRVRPDPDVIAQQLGGELVLLHLRTNRFYELNRTAARLWALLGSADDLQLIQTQLLREYAVDAAQVAQELAQMVALLQREELVTVHESA